MVKIRLTRTGKKGAPHYRIIAIQAKTKRDGKALEYLGYYNPRTNPSTITLEKERIQYWLDQGAQPTDTVRRLLINNNVIEAPKEQKVFKKKPGRKRAERLEAEAEKQAAAEEEKKTKAEEKKEEVKEEPKVEEKAEETKAEETVEEKAEEAKE